MRHKIYMWDPSLTFSGTQWHLSARKLIYNQVSFPSIFLLFFLESHFSGCSNLHVISAVCKSLCIPVMISIAEVFHFVFWLFHYFFHLMRPKIVSSHQPSACYLVISLEDTVISSYGPMIKMSLD